MSRVRRFALVGLWCCACPGSSGDVAGETRGGDAGSSSTTGESENSGDGSTSWSGGEIPGSCAEATTAEQCAAVQGDTDAINGCHWLDLYHLDIVNDACEFAPVSGGGACVGNPFGDTDCGSADACTDGTAYWRDAGGSIEVIRTGSSCTSNPPPGEWTHCQAPDTSSSGDGPSTTGDTTGGAAPDACECACAQLPA